MNKQPVFTVIIPTYNREHFLKRTIDSILSQTFKDFELIIVDDGSTDNTNALIDTYEDNRIVYVKKENGGQNSAINAGLQRAKGQYIAFCDSDDTWMPEKLEKHLQKYQEDSEIKVVYNLTGVIKEEGGEQKIILARDDVYEGWCYREILDQGYLTSPSFLSCKSECFDKICYLPTDVFICQDDDLCFKLCKYYKVGLVKEILGVYHVDAPDKLCAKKKQYAYDFIKFWDIWSDEAIMVCGIESLKDKYVKASYYCLEADEINMAKKVYQRACKMVDDSIEEVKNRIKRELQGDEEIIIYGIGDWGKRIYKMLAMIGFQRLTFAVTYSAQDLDNLYGIPIREIGTLISNVDTPLIIASSDYYHEMKSIAHEKGFNKIVSYLQVKRMIFDREDSNGIL
ncbi:MAG: glycosyltransferase family 2 protein [Lachnospiraceae bacterium]|nr:glycosyltransferase family 2 protein [Lachnospiraceae bacterium]